MKISYHCITCLIKKEAERISSYDDEDKKLMHLKSVLKVFIQTQADSYTAPVLQYQIKKLHDQHFPGQDDPYREIKRRHNQMLIDQEDGICRLIDLAEDKLKTAILFARAGNYIDLAALDVMETEKLDQLLAAAPHGYLDLQVYRECQNQLQKAYSLVYLTDNCGEIVLDKLLLRQIKKQFPVLDICVIVREKPIVNDATLEDADMVGLSGEFYVIGSGSGIGGTHIPDLSNEARAQLTSADVVIAKGQGNYESLQGCGLNIFYLFLCKCDWLVEIFAIKKLTGVFIQE